MIDNDTNYKNDKKLVHYPSYNHDALPVGYGFPNFYQNIGETYPL